MVSEKRIGIFGAGNFGQYVYDLFKSNEKIVCFIDNDATNKSKQISVWSVEELRLRLHEIDQIWISITNYYEMGDIVLQLHDIGVKEIWIVKPQLWDKREKGDSESEIKKKYIYHLDISERAVIAKLEFHVCDACNLNCRGCSHFAPVFTGGFVQIHHFERQMELLSQKFVNIFRFRLMGGEPFLHKELDKFITISRKVLPYTHLEIVTNGLILREVPDNIWQSVRENEAILNISLYPPTFKIKNELVEMLDKKGVEYSFGSALEQYNENGVIKEFHKCFTEHRLHNPITAARYCMGKKCHYLRDGKISKCALPLLSHGLNNYYHKNYVVEEGDYADLNDMKTSSWDMVHKLHNATPFCAYCIEEFPHRFPWKTGGNYTFEDYIVEEEEKI